MTASRETLCWAVGYPVDCSEADFAGDARKDLDAIIAEVVGDRDSPTVTTLVVQGHPAPVLVQAAAGCDRVACLRRAVRHGRGLAERGTLRQLTHG